MGGNLVFPVVDEGLGNSSYLVDLSAGRALAVDASVDLRGLQAEARRRDLRVAFAADTHLHADFLSGGLRLARADGARLLAATAGGREYDHVGLADGDEVDLGGLTLRVLATPGHTGEHLSFELLDGPALLGVFTGGSLIVGGAARTDLAGPAHTEALARAQYRSLRRLLELPDATPVWPTHGAGSFCSAPAGGDRVTTIGHERSTNWLLAAPNENVFVERLLAGLGTFPPYFLDLAERNRRGPAVDTKPVIPALDAAAIAGLTSAGAIVVDLRPVRDFAREHIPGALSIALRPQFASWLGWLLPPTASYVVVRNADQDLDEVCWQALKIGFPPPTGELTGGMAGWDRPTEAIPFVAADGAGDSGDLHTLDVRQASEFDAGHVPGAHHVELGELSRRTATVPAGPMMLMCGHGERAMTAASILRRAGSAEVQVLDGGPAEWSAATGTPLA